MSELSQHLLVFGAGLAAGVVNVMAGGGSLITLPVLLFLGMPAALANGTNRIGILAHNVAAVAGFRGYGVSELKASGRLALATLPGAVLGALVAVEIPDRAFRVILALVLVVAVIALVPPAGAGDGADQAASGGRRPGWPVYLAFVAVGFYGGFIQAGIGFVFLVVLHRLLHLDFVRANVFKVTIIAVYTVPALVVFVWTGNVAWVTGLVLAAGSVVGALVAARISLTGGERPMRIVVGLTLVAMAVRLVWTW